MALTLDEGDSVDARECERRMKDRQCKREREKMRKSKKKIEACSVCKQRRVQSCLYRLHLHYFLLTLAVNSFLYNA